MLPLRVLSKRTVKLTNQISKLLDTSCPLPATNLDPFQLLRHLTNNLSVIKKHLQTNKLSTDNCFDRTTNLVQPQITPEPKISREIPCLKEFDIRMDLKGRKSDCSSRYVQT